MNTGVCWCRMQFGVRVEHHEHAGSSFLLEALHRMANVAAAFRVPYFHAVLDHCVMRDPVVKLSHIVEVRRAFDYDQCFFKISPACWQTETRKNVSKYLARRCFGT